MDPHRGFHHRLLSKRQGLGGVLESLVSVPTPNGDAQLSFSFSPSNLVSSQGATTSAAPQSTGNPLSLGGAVGGITSLVGSVSTLILPSSGPSSTATSSTPLIHSSSSAGSTIASASSAQTSTSASSTTSTSTSTIPTSTPKPTTTPSAGQTVYTTSDGTSVVYVTSTLPASSATAAPRTSFLQDPSLEAGIFTLVGIVALIIVVVIVTWALRKRRRDRLERDLAAAVTFDPGATDHYERQENLTEKHRLSGSTSGHGYGYGMQLGYMPQQEYHGSASYGQYPAATAYNAPSPSSAPYQVPSPTVSQPAGQSGANLTRKFSDRKPVPPLLPNPPHDPSNSHVSVPPQFYQQ